MKKLILSLLGICFLLISHAQKAQYFEKDPKGMKFIPRGSFEKKDPVSGQTKKISVDAFWMSNEVTNAEYREFVVYARQHPDEMLEWLDMSQMAKDKSEGRNVQVKDYMRTQKYSQILFGIIDTLHLPYPDYFSNKKYDKYPVVGVSLHSAINFCMWKTAQVNDKLKKAKKPLMQQFRVPLDEEWEYVAVEGKIDETLENPKSIQPSKSGKSNKFGLYNISGNVAEWTANNLKGKDKNSGYNNVGFRIVCSSLSGTKLISQN